MLEKRQDREGNGQCSHEKVIGLYYYGHPQTCLFKIQESFVTKTLWK